MTSILFALLFNPNSFMVYAVLIALALGIYFTMGLPKLIKIATDIRVWFAIGGILAVLAFAHMEKRNQDLETQIKAAAAQAQSTEDGAAVIETRQRQQAGRRAQTQRIDDAIRTAPTGGAQDAALDAIAAERPDYHGALDDALDQRQSAEPAVAAPVAQQPVAQPPAGEPPLLRRRGTMPVVAGDGVRKQLDGVVVP